MKVTVCALSDNETKFALDWLALVQHCREQQPDLVLLPELPFSKWIAISPTVTVAEKQEAACKHDVWSKRLRELNARYVVYSRPVVDNGEYFNTAFLYQQGEEQIALHSKCYFPEEPHFYEQNCYTPGQKDFIALDAGDFKIGIMLCTEMWFTANARDYGKQGVDLLLCPRATDLASIPQWMRLGQTLAIISGAYCLSSNKAGHDVENNFEWGGGAFITAPGNGELLGHTGSTGFVTIEIDLDIARRAKTDYPQYVKEN
jgi:predicted amidohydrolase